MVDPLSEKSMEWWLRENSILGFEAHRRTADEVQAKRRHSIESLTALAEKIRAECSAPKEATGTTACQCPWAEGSIILDDLQDLAEKSALHKEIMKAKARFREEMEFALMRGDYLQFLPERRRR